jgi:hypothetical protein
MRAEPRSERRTRLSPVAKIAGSCDGKSLRVQLRRMSAFVFSNRGRPDLRFAPGYQQGHGAAQHYFSRTMEGQLRSTTHSRLLHYAGSYDEGCGGGRNPPTGRQLDCVGADEHGCRQCQRQHPNLRTCQKQEYHSRRTADHSIDDPGPESEPRLSASAARSPRSPRIRTKAGLAAIESHRSKGRSGVSRLMLVSVAISHKLKSEMKGRFSSETVVGIGNCYRRGP